MTDVAVAARPGGREQRGARTPVALLVALTVVTWLALARLAWAFLTEQLEWRYVAEQSRVDAPWPYRLAGVWGGMEGSLLLFAGIVGVVGVVAARRADVVARWAAAVTVATLVAVDLLLASPFGRLDTPSVQGFGMNPILEHPAMTIHPPMLYAGLAAAFGAAIVPWGTARPFNESRPWLLATIGALTAAMALGAAWSYLEQGWGGYWAWDPVENTSLLVWLAAVAALHGGPLARRDVTRLLGAAPWVLATVGAVLVRSGATPSIHGFAEQPAVGWALAGLATATVAFTTFAFVQQRAPGRPPVHKREGFEPRVVTVVVTSVAVGVVLVGTVAPVVGQLVGQGDTAVRGEFYSRTVGPLALLATPFLLARLRRWHGWSTVAHAGAAVLLLGIGMSTFDRDVTAPVAAGATERIAGLVVRNHGVTVRAGPRVATDAVVADLVVAGHEMRPAIVVYPDRGGRLAEVAARPGVVTDVLVVLDGAADDGAVVVTLHVRRLMWLVWLGAAVVAVATLAAAVRSHAGAGASRTAGH